MYCKGRYCRKRLANIAFFLTCMGLVILGIYYNEGLLTHLPSSSRSDVIHRGQLGSHAQTRTQGHFSHGKKKKKRLHGHAMKALSEEDMLECKVPVLSLKTDANAAAYTQMPPLFCKGERLMYLENSVLKLNKTVLRSRKLKECNYYSIEWNRQPPMEETYNLVTIAKRDSASNFTVNVARHDFIKIECYFQKINGNPRSTDHERPNSRKLLADVNFDEYNVKKSHRKVKRRAMKEGNIHKGANDLIKGGYFTRPKQELNNQQDNERSSMDNQSLNQIQQSIHNNHEMDKKRNKISDKFVESDNQGYSQHGNDNLISDTSQDDAENSQDFGESFFGVRAADFEQYVVQIAPQEAVFERQTDLPPHPDATRLNVLMLALDSMSHLSYQRKLPLTYSYLRDTLGAIVLNGYNIVGDATTAALIPMFTGKMETELPEARKNHPDSGFVDSFNLIWNRFEHNGYVTLYAEDQPSFGTFNLRLNGFEHKPADHYMRPFWNALDDYEDDKQKDQFCLHGLPKHRYFLQYAKQFFTRYKNISKFAFAFYGELSHADNSPAEYIDKDMVTLLKYMKRRKHLDNTLLIVMGDHGARYRKVRHTIQGKMEERLPLMTLTFPRWFREKYPDLMQNLQRNAHRLTTPFDLYVTLQTVLDVKMARKKILYKDRGISLLNNIPMNRTCDAAGVAPHWCSCMMSQDVDITSANVKQAAVKVVQYINQLTSQHREKCSQLHLDQILSAQILAPNQQVLRYYNSLDGDQRVANFTSKVKVDMVHYQITIVTAPSNAMYESTVQYNIDAETLEVTPEISRINIYGNQPYCIEKEHPDLRKYCFCANYQSWEKKKRKMNN